MGPIFTAARVGDVRFCSLAVLGWVSSIEQPRVGCVKGGYAKRRCLDYARNN